MSGDKPALSAVFKHVFLDCVYEDDVTWIAGEMRKDSYFSIWDRLKFSMGFEHASRMVIDGAVLRGSNAKAGSVLAEAIKPYSSLLNIDLPYGKKKDYTLQEIPFSATSGFRTLQKRVGLRSRHPSYPHDQGGNRRVSSCQ